MDDDFLACQFVLQAAHRGDPAAWEALFKECYPKVRRAVRRKLKGKMRSLFDSTDFASDVMKSLVDNLDRLDFPSIQSLMAFLAQAAEKKVIDEHRRRHYDAQRQSLAQQLRRAFALSSGHDEHQHG